jgi:hypothetical protein
MSIVSAKLQYGPWDRVLREVFLFDDADCSVEDIGMMLTVYANPSHPYYKQGACITLAFTPRTEEEWCCDGCRECGSECE